MSDKVETMRTPEFETQLARIRKVLDNPVRVPRYNKRYRQISWDAKHESEGVLELRATVDASLLEQDFQKDDAAAATFLLCLAYWLEKSEECESHVKCKMDVVGSFSKRGNKLLHSRRSLFLLEEYRSLFPDRFSFDVEDGSRWKWPEKPFINSPSGPRKGADLSRAPSEGRLSERMLEKMICRDKNLVDTFPYENSPPKKLMAQFPVGIFEGIVSGSTRFTPGSTSEVDLLSTIFSTSAAVSPTTIGTTVRLAVYPTE